MIVRDDHFIITMLVSYNIAHESIAYQNHTLKKSRYLMTIFDIVNLIMIIIIITHMHRVKA